MPRGRARDPRPAGDDDGDDQDLQHRRRPYRQRHHSRRSAARALPRPDERAGHLAQLLRHGDGDRRLQPRGRGLGRCARALSRRQPPAVRRGHGTIPGVRSMALESTYLAWVDFSGTGMEPTEFTARIEKQAKIAANHGASFGAGGDSFLRFNLATPRAVIAEAVARLQQAFADLQ